MTVFHSCLCFTSLQQRGQYRYFHLVKEKMFHLSPYENVCTIALITFHIFVYYKDVSNNL